MAAKPKGNTMSNSSYTVVSAQGFIATRSSKPAAIKLANEAQGEVEVIVTTAKGTVVHEVPATGTRAKPFTRTEVPTFEVPQVKGFTVAYTRARIQTVVLRADDRSGYLVLHVPTDTRTEAANTVEAREITNALGKAIAEQKAEAAAQEKADKAEAKAAKLAAKEAEAAAAAEVEAPAELVEA